MDYVITKPKDVFLMIEAYNERYMEQMDLFRIHAFYCYAPHAKKLTPQKFLNDIWPSPRDAKDKEERQKSLIERARREYDKVKRN